MQKHLRFFILSILFITVATVNVSCSGGNGGFSDLIGGDLSDVDELTIISTTPASDTVTVAVGSSQGFTVLAQTPPPANVTYYFTLDGSNVSSINAYNLTGTVPLIGNHTVTAHATDGISTKSRSWTVKVNGPPVITSNYLTPNPTPKVAVGSTLNLTVTATDPNGDAMTYDWEINGVSSAYLVGTNNTAVLTADESILPGGVAGPINISVTATDTSSASTTYTFAVEINAFDQTCNELAQFEMCTYVGIPTLGNGYDPADPSVSSTIKMGPIALAVDDRNDNLIIADWNHNLVWYWNRTASAVDFLYFEGGTAIPANTIKVIAGTGEAATESGDYSLAVGVNGPRGLYYDSGADRLYISEWNAGRVKIVASNGITSYSLGVGGGHTDATVATAHACGNPSGLHFYNSELYVACYGSHRVKAWNLSTNMVRTVYGATSGNSANFRNDRSAPVINGTYAAGGTEDGKAYVACTGGGNANCGFRNPYDIHVDADGLYVTHPTDNYVRFCNFSGAPKVMFGLTIGNGFCRSILGSNTAGAGGTGFGAGSGDPKATNFENPYGITVDSGKIFVTSNQGNNDRIVLLNNTGANILVGDYGVAINNQNFAPITSTSAGYTEGAPANTRQFNDPYDIIIEPDTGTFTRSYLVADYGNRRVRRLNYAAGASVSVLGSGRLRDDNIGDTGLANAFYMNSPSGLVYDNQTAVNSLFIADANNGRILRVDKYGNVNTVAGGGSTVPNGVNGAQSPTSITLNSSVVAFTGIAMFADFSIILNNAVSSHFQIWNRSGTTKAYLNATTTGNNRVNQLAGNFNLPDNATAGNYDDDATSPMLVSLANPSGVAIAENLDVGSTKEVFISDQYRHCIRRVYEVSSGVFGMDTVVGQCKDGSQPTNTFPGQAQGGSGASVDSDVPTNHILHRPMDLITHMPTDADITAGGGVIGNKNGKANLIIADYVNNKVRYWNRTGTAVQFAGVTIGNGSVETIACTTGSNNTSENIFAQGAQCNNPIGFAMNEDYLCYTQGGKHNVRCIYLTGANEGRIFTVAGSPQANTVGVSGIPYDYTLEGLPATQQKLNFPTGLAFDSNGDLYISDQNNHMVKKVKMTP